MSFLRSKSFQALLVLMGTFLLFRFGIRPPAPWSVLKLYMAIVLVAVLVYVSSDSDSWRAFLAPVRSTLADDSKRPIRFAVMVLLPSLLGYYAYTQAAAKVEAPAELRAVHPAPPASISFRRKTINIQGLENPLRKDAANFNKYVAEGAVIYVKNCLFCHGDNLDGAGHFAHAFNPPPANFTDPGTIAMLQEAFLFWRIAKGGPGLPKESTPWNSVMPAWEDRLTEEEIWKVIMYLYDATGYQPRRWEAHASAAPVPPRTRPPLSLTLFARGTTEPSGLAEAQPRGDAVAGKVIYEKKCAVCHGAEGKGDGPGAVQLDPDRVTSPEACTRSARALRGTRRRTRTCSRSLLRACREHRCRRGMSFLKRGGGTWSPTSGPSPPTSSRSHRRWRISQRRWPPPRSPSPEGKRCSRRLSATNATATGGGAMALQRLNSRTTGETPYARPTSPRSGDSGEGGAPEKLLPA